MTTIHLTDAQRDTFAGSGLITVHAEVVDAPEGWRILTEPCDTCGEYSRPGVIYREKGDQENWLDGRIAEEPCPDCAGGRRVVTLTANCYHPDRDRIGRLGHLLCTRCKAESNPGNGYRWRPNPGLVTLGRFTIRVWRIIPLQEAAVDVAWVTESPPASQRGLFIPLDGYGTATRFDLDPLPRPGQFIARPERVE